MVPPSNDCEIRASPRAYGHGPRLRVAAPIGSSVLASTTRMGVARPSHHQTRFLRIANLRRRPATARARPIPFPRL